MSDYMPPFTPQPPGAPGSFTGIPEAGGAVQEIIPWEERATRGWIDALVENVKLCLFEPADFFRRMPRAGDLGSPVLYILILGWIGGGVTQVWQYLFGQWFGSFLGQPPPALGFTIGMIVGFPFGIVIGLFIGAGILHLGLMIVGGAKSGFESTLRVMAYSTGSAGIFQVVPILGPLVGGIWGMVIEIMGLAKVNNITYLRATVAVFLPILACCACIGAGAAIMIPMIMKAINAT